MNTPAQWYAAQARIAELEKALQAIDNLVTNYPDSTAEECAAIANATLTKETA